MRGHVGIPGNERVDEIADAFATGQDPGLYRGALSGYGRSILDVPSDTSLPKRASGSSVSKGKSSAKAYSYLSVVDGAPMRHGTWAECEQRVKGVKGARFKKVRSPAEERDVFTSWGVTDDDLFGI